jgi:hypothetical protein
MCDPSANAAHPPAGVRHDAVVPYGMRGNAAHPPAGVRHDAVVPYGIQRTKPHDGMTNSR